MHIKICIIKIDIVNYAHLMIQNNAEIFAKKTIMALFFEVYGGSIDMAITLKNQNTTVLL